MAEEIELLEVQDIPVEEGAGIDADNAEDVRIHFVKLDVLIYGNYWMLRLILLDMLLLENQLPLFVLECLWELIGQPRDTLRNGAINSFEYFFSCKLEVKSREEDVIHHLLHLLHLSLKPDSPTRKAETTSASGKLSSLRLCQNIGKTLRFLCPTYLINTYDRFRTPSQQSLPESKQKSPQPLNMIPSATELQEAGVRFQLKQARSFFEVRFEQGLMEMSSLWIFDETNILFRNFIAFEQCFPYFSNHFTSYCSFIGFLVNTPRDVSILRDADIIRSGLGSNEEVALLFNKLGKEIVWYFDDSYIADLVKDVNQHTQKRWPKWRAKLVRDYFSNPWAITSLIAAIIILILTFLQTYFSAFDYFNTPKP
ncbi:hypothetical protein AAC387_Pa11g1742 [Persea americana]